MDEKRDFEDLTPEELGNIGIEVWKALAAVNAAVDAAEGGKPDADSLMLIAKDYLKAADEHISAYI